MKILNKQDLTNNIFILNTKLQNSFLLNFFSKKLSCPSAAKKKHLNVLSTFGKIKLSIINKKNFVDLNLKKNKNFLKYSTKKAFFIPYSKFFGLLRKKKICEYFLRVYLNKLNVQVRKEKKFFVCFAKKINFKFFNKLIKTNLLQKQFYDNLRKITFSIYRFLLKSKIIFLNTNFFCIFSLSFLNKQIQRFTFFYLFSKRTEFYYFCNFLKVFFYFSFLNIFLFDYLYEMVKKKHLNNSNSWVFAKYWLFLQPFPYFFHSNANFIDSPSYLKKLFIKRLKKPFFFICSRHLKYLTINQTFFFLCFKQVLNLIFNLFSQKVISNQNSYKKVLVSKTYYLDQYKTKYLFKLNLKKRQIKFYYYFLSTQPNSLEKKKLRFNHKFIKFITNKSTTFKKIDYRLSKLFLVLN